MRIAQEFALPDDVLVIQNTRISWNTAPTMLTASMTRENIIV